MDDLVKRIKTSYLKDKTGLEGIDWLEILSNINSIMEEQKELKKFHILITSSLTVIAPFDLGVFRVDACYESCTMYVPAISCSILGVILQHLVYKDFPIPDNEIKRRLSKLSRYYMENLKDSKHMEIKVYLDEVDSKRHFLLGYFVDLDCEGKTPLPT